VAPRDDEEELLRSVALQNAQSILLARQRAEEALQKQSELLRVTLASIGDAVITTDTEGRVTMLNPVAEALTGWTQAEAAGRPVAEVFRIVNEETRAPVASPVEWALHEGVVVGLANHTVLLAKDGREIPIDDSSAPIRDATGAVHGVVLVFRDITERRRAEASRAHLAAIVESSDDAIISKSLQGIITSWNKGAEKIFGYTAAETVGRSITMLIPPQRLDEEPQILGSIGRGETVAHYETVRRRKDGTDIDISLTVSPIRDEAGNVIGASKIARDITERRRAEEKLHEQQQQYEALIWTSAQLVWETNAEGAVETDSPTWQEFTGQTFDERKGFGWLDALHPDDHEHVSYEWQKAVETKMPIKIDYRVRHHSGEWRWMTARATPLLNADGLIRKWVGMNTDITERKQAEVTERLFAEMRERNRLAQELHDTVAQALGYLNLKIGMTHTLLAENKVDTAKASLQELKGVISETYTDVREEIFYLRAKALSELSFMELLERYIDKYHRFYNLDIQLLREAEPTSFQFSPEVTAQLIRIIQEALINVRKHARVNTATIRLGQENGAIRISIEDEGQGFDPAQSPENRSSFGLLIMRERVESVGGSLEIESVPGRGTRVMLRFRQAGVKGES
jgi:PAS domain S-box-containing protein